MLKILSRWCMCVVWLVTAEWCVCVCGLTGDSRVVSVCVGIKKKECQSPCLRRCRTRSSVSYVMRRIVKSWMNCHVSSTAQITIQCTSAMRFILTPCSIGNLYFLCKTFSEVEVSELSHGQQWTNCHTCDIEFRGRRDESPSHARRCVPRTARRRTRDVAFRGRHVTSPHHSESLLTIYHYFIMQQFLTLLTSRDNLFAKYK